MAAAPIHFKLGRMGLELLAPRRRGARTAGLLVSALAGATSLLALAQPAPEPAAPAPVRAARTAAPAAPPADDAARRAAVYARIGDETITVGDIEDRIAAQTTFRADRYADPERLREFADSLVDVAVLSAEAERRGHGARRNVRRGYEEVLVQQLIREEFDEPFRNAPVSAADVAAYYEAHRDEFVVPDQVRASHILVATEQEAREIIAQVGPMDVRGRRQLARDRSLDTETKLSGGDLRAFTRSGLPPGQTTGTPVHPAIVEAAFSLDERGEVYPTPVPVDGRFSVVMLALRRPGVTRTLAEATPGITRRINQTRRREAIDRLVAELEARVRPEKHPERLDAIVVAPTAGPPGLPPHPETAAQAHEHAH